MWMLFGILVVLLPFFLLLFSWIKNHREWKYIMEIPGPRAHPIIGTLLDVGTDTAILFSGDRRRANVYFPIYKLWFFNGFLVGLVSAEDIELVLNNMKHIQKSIIYNFLHAWLGTGLLTSTGSKWQSRRKILTPAFHFNILQEFIHIFNKETQVLVQKLEKDSDKPYTDVVKPITGYALHSIGETSLGVDLSQGNSPYKTAIYKYGDILMKRIVCPWLYNDNIYKLSSLGRQDKKIVRVLHEFSTKVIDERKKLFSPTGEISYSKRKRLAMLDLMLKAKYDGLDIDDDGIREEVDTFMFEGHDTTAMALSLTLMALANEEKIQEEILQEITEVLGDIDTLPTYNDLMEMKFMERCIKECLRLYPSVPFIARIIGEDIKTHSGYTIPKGCYVNIYIYDLHRSPKYWENPEKFDPDRFLPENIANRHPFAYLPFSAGPRNCIGQRFAVLELKAALCGILRKFKLIPVDTPKDIKFKSDLVLRPVGEVRTKFQIRK